MLTEILFHVLAIGITQNIKLDLSFLVCNLYPYLFTYVYILGFARQICRSADDTDSSLALPLVHAH